MSDSMRRPRRRSVGCCEMTSWQSGERADCCLEVRLLRAEPGAWIFVRWWTFFFPSRLAARMCGRQQRPSWKGAETRIGRNHCDGLREGTLSLNKPLICCSLILNMQPATIQGPLSSTLARRCAIDRHRRNDNPFTHDQPCVYCAKKRLAIQPCTASALRIENNGDDNGTASRERKLL